MSGRVKGVWRDFENILGGIAILSVTMFALGFVALICLSAFATPFLLTAYVLGIIH